MRNVSVALGALVILTGSIAADTPGSALRQSFVLPSGLIGCTYTPGGGPAMAPSNRREAHIACDRVGTHATRVVMAATGRPQIVNDPDRSGWPQPHAKLAYGRVWINGPFACETSVGGVTCTRADGEKMSVTTRVVVVR